MFQVKNYNYRNNSPSTHKYHDNYCHHLNGKYYSKYGDGDCQYNNGNDDGNDNLSTKEKNNLESLLNCQIKKYNNTIYPFGLKPSGLKARRAQAKRFNSQL